MLANVPKYYQFRIRKYKRSVRRSVAGDTFRLTESLLFQKMDIGLDNSQVRVVLNMA